VITDLNLWRTCLTCPAVTHSLLPRRHLDPNIHIDASSSFGLGFAFENWYAGWSLIDGWAAEGRDIGWAESVALELAVYWLIQEGFHDANIVVHLDNTGVIGAFSNGRSRNPACNDCSCPTQPPDMILSCLPYYLLFKLLCFIHVYILCVYLFCTSHVLVLSAEPPSGPHVRAARIPSPFAQ